MDDATAQALIEKAERLDDDGDLEGAKAALRDVVDRGGDGQWVATALDELARLYRREGDETGEKLVYERAVERVHGNTLSTALAGLARIAGQGGDTDQAAVLYERAAEEGDVRRSVYALCALGDVLAKSRRFYEAESAFRRAEERDGQVRAMHARAGLARVFREQGNLDEAAAAYREVAASDDPQHAAIGLLGLGSVLTEQGNTVAARAAYESALNLGSTASYRAIVELRALLLRAGNRDEADEIYQGYVGAHSDEIGSLGFQLLGNWLADSRDYDGARDAYGRAVARGDRLGDQSRWPMANAIRDSGDVDGAIDAYLETIKLGERSQRGAAAGSLRDLLREAGIDKARVVCGRVIASDDSTLHAAGAFILAELLAGSGEIAAAKALYADAEAVRDPIWSPFAAINLGDVLTGEGNLEHARQAYERAVASDDPDWQNVGRERLAGLDGDPVP